MTKIFHISHTDISVDHRILRAVKSGIAAGFQVNALGFSQTRPTKINEELAKKLGIQIAVRPDFLRSRTTGESNRVSSDHFEISEGTTNKLQKAMFILWFAFVIFTRTIKARQNIIHAHDYLVLPCAAFLSFVLGAKLVYDAHELESQRSGDTKQIRKLIYLIEKTNWIHIDGFVTVSNSIGAWYFEKFGGPLATVVLNTPETVKRKKQVLEPALTVREAIEATAEDVIYIFVGTLEPGNGIEKAVSVFSGDIQNGKLVILGDGSLRNSLIQQSKLQTNLYILEPVAHNVLVEYISTADYGLCVTENTSLSYYLALPNKVFEYLNAGLSLICSDFPEMADIVNKLEYGYLVDEKPSSLEQLFHQLSNTERPNHKTVDFLDEYSWKVQSEKLQNLYISITSK